MRLAQILIVLMAWWMLNNINEYKDDRDDKDHEDDEDDKQTSIMSMAVPKMNMNLIKKIMTMLMMKIPGKEAGPRM